MKKRPFPTPIRLRQILSYDPQSGELTWKARSQSDFDSYKAFAVWTAKYKGKPALKAKTKSGHLRGQIDGHGCLAHRAIWALVYGAWPPAHMCVDHADMNPSNNKIENLRLATKRQNGCNRQPKRGAKSKYLGVTRRCDDKAWQASISVKGKTISLGKAFQREEAAALAYDAAARRYHGEFARPNFNRNSA